MATVNYTTEQLQQIQDLQQYIQETGADVELYTKALDGQTIDPQLLNDPAFQAYWKLAFLRLTEILNPEAIMAGNGDVDMLDFDAVYASTDPAYRDFLKQLILDSPELMGFAADIDSDEATSSAEILSYIEKHISKGLAVEEAPYQYIDEEARALKEELGLGDMWDWLIGTEEGVRSAETALLGELADLDQQQLEAIRAMRSGEMNETEASAQLDSISALRQVYLGAIQQLEENWKNILELFSQLLKKQDELVDGVVRNLGAG